MSDIITSAIGTVIGLLALSFVSTVISVLRTRRLRAIMEEGRRVAESTDS